MMRTLYRSATAFLILGVALLSITLALKRSDASPAVASSNATVAQQSHAPRWEYKRIAAQRSEELMVQANQAGADSWEMVSVVHDSSSNVAWVGFFKRLKP